MNFPINKPNKLAEMFGSKQLRGKLEEDIQVHIRRLSKGCKSWPEFISRIECALKAEDAKINESGIKKRNLQDAAIYKEAIEMVRPAYALLVLEKRAKEMRQSDY